MKRFFAVAAVLMLTVSALVAVPWGDEAACKSSAESTEQALRMYKVTGGGQIAGRMIDRWSGLSTLADCTIGFTAQPVGEPLSYDGHEAKGEIELVDHTNGITFHGTVDAGWPTYPGENCAHFTGDGGRISTSGGMFDVGWFCFTVTEYDCVFVPVDYDGNAVCWKGELEKGNITFHKPKKN